MAFLQWLEATPFSSWLRESSSLFAYPAVVFLHALGLTLAAGPSVVISMRLLGAGRALPVAPFARVFPLIWIGFWTSVVSGLVMLATDATSKLQNPLFGVKMVFVVLSAAAMFAVRRQVARSEDATRDLRRGRWLAAASLACWAGAIAAGRFMTYL